MNDDLRRSAWVGNIWTYNMRLFLSLCVLCCCCCFSFVIAILFSALCIRIEFLCWPDEYAHYRYESKNYCRTRKKTAPRRMIYMVRRITIPRNADNRILHVYRSRSFVLNVRTILKKRARTQNRLACRKNVDRMEEREKKIYMSCKYNLFRWNLTLLLIIIDSTLRCVALWVLFVAYMANSTDVLISTICIGLSSSLSLLCCVLWL